MIDDTGFTKIERALFPKAREVGANAHHIYLALRALVDWKKEASEDFIVCYATIKEIAECTARGYTTVSKALIRLEEMGWIRREVRPRQPGCYVLGTKGKLLALFPRQEQTQTQSCSRVRNTPVPASGTGSVPASGTRLFPRQEQRPLRGTRNLPNDAGELASRARARLIDIDQDRSADPLISGKIRYAPNGTPLDPVIEEKKKTTDTITLFHGPSSPTLQNFDRGEFNGARNSGPPNSAALVELWMSTFEKVFNQEDLSLRTKVARDQASKLILRRTAQWLKGDADGMRRYLKTTLKWWSLRIEEGFEFPSGLPSVEALLSEKNRKPSHYFGMWQSKQMVRELRGEVRL